MVAVSNRVLQTAQVIEITSKLEELLDSKGGIGKGLHEKATSIERQISDGMMRQIRFLASVRNKFMHKDFEMPEQEFEGLLRTASRVLSDFKSDRPVSRTDVRPASASASAPGLFLRNAAFWSLGILIAIYGYRLYFAEYRLASVENSSHNAIRPSYETRKVELPVLQKPESYPSLVAEPNEGRRNHRVAPSDNQTLEHRMTAKRDVTRVDVLEPVEKDPAKNNESVSDSRPNLSLEQIRNLTRNLN